MRKFISSIHLLFVSLGFFISGVLVTHAEGAVVQFEIIAPASSRVNEAIDVTVRAIDKDKQVVTGYRGSIIFVPENFGDTVPMPGKSISFNAEDNGEKKFSKGVIFKTSGKQKVSVVDVSDDISGEAIVSVEALATNSGSNLEEVTIISPSKDSKITSEVVVISGKARKNSKLMISLNGKDMGSVLSDESGVFTKSLSGITQASNLLSVSLVDGAGTIVGKSPDIAFEKISGGPAYYNTTVTPGTNVETSGKITLTVEAEAGLSEVGVILDGASLKATETSPGKYTLDTVAPAKSGTYPVSINITNTLGQKITKESVVSITVSEAPSVFENVKATTNGSKVIFNFTVKNPPGELDRFKIAYGDNPDSFSNDVTTWSTGKILKDGKFEWYIDKLAPKTYSFKILGARTDNSIIESLTSEVISATIGSTTCTVGNVGMVRVETLSDKSILSWDTVTGALSYNIYKIAPNGDATLFQNTKETKYTIFLASGSVVQEDFGLKALCDNTTESADYSKASKVQTGPGGLLAILLIISGIVAAFFMRKRVL